MRRPAGGAPAAKHLNDDFSALSPADAVLDKYEELAKQEIYFSTTGELNDPMEGYLKPPRKIDWVVYAEEQFARPRHSTLRGSPCRRIHSGDVAMLGSKTVSGPLPTISSLSCLSIIFDASVRRLTGWNG